MKSFLSDSMRLSRWLTRALLLVSICGTPVISLAEEAAEKKKERSFVRIHRDEKGEPLSFDTAIVSYRGEKGKYAGVQVDLVGAVHVGDKAYYDQLNTLFTKYDVVLYELVAPEGTRIPKDRKPTSNHPVSAMQSGMKSMLGLEHQLERIDYTKSNLVHADMSPEDFSKSMKDRNESFMQLFFRMMGQGIAKQAQDPGRKNDAQLFAAFFSKDRDVQLKRAMAEQFQDMEGSMEVFEGDHGSTIISERNKKAFQVLDRELTAGKKRVAVFYGAGHLPDMEKRLLNDYGMIRTGQQWLPAWGLTSQPVAAAPVKK